jgi:predicted nucleic acid-binding protein
VIVLDTNVLSEVLRPAPEPKVLAWLSSRPRSSLFTSSVTRAEILFGLRLLPEGQRRQGLWTAALAIFDVDLAGQTLNFDSSAADAFAEISADRRSLGKPISQFDAMIAAIARSRGASLATRNVRDFDNCGIDVLNPWDG